MKTSIANSNVTGPLLTTRQAVEAWGISKWTLQEMVRRGEIKRVMGLRTKEHRFRADAFDQYLKRVGAMQAA